MPDMPAVFYGPALAAMVTVIGVLWRRNLQLADKLISTIELVTDALAKAAHAVDTNTLTVQEIHRDLVGEAEDDYASRPRRPRRPPERRG